MANLNRVLFVALVAAMAFGVASIAVACPTCKDSLAGDPAHANIVRGYFWSILFMMSMPFLILGGLAGYFYYEVRRARARQASAKPQLILSRG